MKKLKLASTLFWIIFLTLAAIVILPGIRYLWDGLPPHFNRSSTIEILGFAMHITTGTLVLTLAVFQFSKNFRNRNMGVHRIFGNLYVFFSIVSVLILLFDIIPGSGCIACRPSQTTASVLWLTFCLAAWYSIHKKMLVTHQRLMISSFICAAYFVTVRLIDRLAMGSVMKLFPDEYTAYLISDVMAWLIPLTFFWMYWLLTDWKGREKPLLAE